MLMQPAEQRTIQGTGPMKNWTAAHQDNPAAQQGLRECRAEIDAIDDEILDSLDRRAQAVQRLAAIKRQHSIAVFDQGREQQVMQRVSAHENTLPPERRRAIFTTILEQMREWQLVLNRWTED
jgi:chorismate mutase